MYIKTVLFYDCITQKSYKMLSVRSFEKGYESLSNKITYITPFI